MKKTIIVIASIMTVVLGCYYIIKTNDRPEQEIEDVDPLEDTNVYVDNIGCLHTDRDCFNLIENYAVKIYKKTDSGLSSKYEYVCIDCFKPEHLVTEEVDWEQFRVK